MVAFGATLRARSSVGSSSCRPLTNTTSAPESVSETLGAGSNVCELVPSGTMPRIRARSPMTLAAMEVMGLTVVTTSGRLSSAGAASVSPPHAATTKATTSGHEEAGPEHGPTIPARAGVATWLQLHPGCSSSSVASPVVGTVGHVPGPSVDDLVSRLRAAGVRMTAPRRMALTALIESGSHVTAETLLQRVRQDHPEVSPSSIYRTMDLLADLGIVEHVHLGHGAAQYHLADDHHAHLVCNGCGAIVELAPELSAPFATVVEADLGFHLDLGHFALAGWCAGCRPQG